MAEDSFFYVERNGVWHILLRPRLDDESCNCPVEFKSERLVLSIVRRCTNKYCGCDFFLFGISNDTFLVISCIL